MTDIAIFEDFCKENGVYYRRDVSLAGLCTFKIGGNAPLVIEPGGTEQIEAVMAFMGGKGCTPLVLGKGSNMLFPDHGIDRAVILLGERYSSMRLEDEETIFCRSGASLIQLCRFALDKGLSGLEFAYGIPGSVGGAVYMNAGAYGGEMKDVVLKAFHVDDNGKQGALAGADIGFGYRESAYTRRRAIITGALFRLQKGDKDAIRAKMEDFMARRRDKQPLEFPSAGSTFKRPQGAYASALIDQCGLKGFSVGGAQISEKHAGFVINKGGATCADVRQLMQTVREIVWEKTGFVLEPEVRMADGPALPHE
ncbi:MAG: UDP-N-acetylmuramate dehydrogenase [Oscillospiraceae bacterium]|jgi:UDP-N-acetylmuramate dehydrogenase|nr:UDP-N-acetylmuramate dehydrogenase [Oscillospiraceae bacterium]